LLTIFHYFPILSKRWLGELQYAQSNTNYSTLAYICPKFLKKSGMKTFSRVFEIFNSSNFKNLKFWIWDHLNSLKTHKMPCTLWMLWAFLAFFKDLLWYLILEISKFINLEWGHLMNPRTFKIIYITTSSLYLTEDMFIPYLLQEFLRNFIQEISEFLNLNTRWYGQSFIWTPKKLFFDFR
jgi:hypothetical protein